MPRLEGLSDKGLVEGSRLLYDQPRFGAHVGQRGEIEANRARAAAKGSEFSCRYLE